MIRNYRGVITMRTDGSIAFWASYTDLVFLSQTDENHKGLSKVLQGWPKTKTLLQKECLHSLGLFHFKKQQLQKTWHNPQACKGTRLDHLLQPKRQGHCESSQRQGKYNRRKWFFTTRSLWKLLTTGCDEHPELTRCKGRLNKRPAWGY